MSQQGTILLADDEETFLEATRDLLQEEGYECQAVRNAHDLSTALRAVDFDLLITDLNMPGNRVLEMVDEIHHQSLSLPVIVVTGYPSLPTAVESVRMNVMEYMIKPIDFQRLLELVKQAIQHKRILRTVRKARQEVEQRSQRLAEIERTLGVYGTEVDEETGNAIITDPRMRALERQIEGLAHLLETGGPAAAKGSTESASPAGASSLADYYKLREGLYDAIQVLQRTKSAFRSKDLAALRKKLQDLLKDTPPSP